MIDIHAYSKERKPETVITFKIHAREIISFL